MHNIIEQLHKYRHYLTIFHYVSKKITTDKL